MVVDLGSLKTQHKEHHNHTRGRRNVWLRLRTTLATQGHIPTGKRASTIIIVRICHNRINMTTCRQLTLNLGKRDTNRQCRTDLQGITRVAKTTSSKAYCRSTTISKINKLPETQWALSWVLLLMPRQTSCHYPV